MQETLDTLLIQFASTISKYQKSSLLLGHFTSEQINIYQVRNYLLPFMVKATLSINNRVN